MLNVAFFGTPDFAVPSLAALVKTGYRPVVVVSQPARPVGRGKKLRDPPVAAWARANGLAVRQPEKVREKTFMTELRDLELDVAVVVAFGQIFRRALLELPRHGCINVHASLLPRYRGAAPIQCAIADGETRTGVTTMQMDRGMDTGAILATAETEIGPHETTAELSPRLARLGADLIVETLRQLETGALSSRPQADTLATHAPLLTKADALVDWGWEAKRIYDRFRANQPWPGMVSELRGETIKILAAEVLGEGATEEEPGTVLGLNQSRLAVACGGGTMLGLGRVQRPGRQGVPASDFANGLRLQAGERFRPPA